jgi:hypothetical protein
MYKVQDYDQAFFTKTLLNQLYVKIDILLTCGYHLDPQHVELPVQWSSSAVPVTLLQETRPPSDPILKTHE